jgi:hypothetical protein
MNALFSMYRFVPINEHTHDNTNIYPMKLITVKWRMQWANIKSANPRSGLIPQNWLLFAGFTWRRRQTEKFNYALIIRTAKIIDKILCTCQNKTCYTGNESTKKWIEWKSSNKAAVDKLNDAGKKNIKYICIN